MLKNPDCNIKYRLKRLVSTHFQFFVMLTALISIMLIFALMTDFAYLSARNISNLLRQTAITGILSVGMVFIIVSAEIDLSVGSMMGLLGGLAAIFDVWLKWSLPITISITLAIGLLLGAWNGWWVAYRKVPSFIVTLAGMLAFRGILIGITNGSTVAPTTFSLSQIGQSYIPNGIGLLAVLLGIFFFIAFQWYCVISRKKMHLEIPKYSTIAIRQILMTVLLITIVNILNTYQGIPTPAAILIFLLLGGVFLAKKTVFGRHVYAIGGNLEAAKLSGINVERTKMLLFSINGLMVAVAGLILSARLGAGSPSAGNIAELDAIAACVIGGTSLSGGIGSISGAVVGAFIMSSLDNGMSMVDVPNFWQYIVKGSILLLAVWLDCMMKKR